MATLAEAVADLIKDLAAIQKSAGSRSVRDDDDFPFPRMIPTGDGRSIVVSKKIDQIIAETARRMLYHSGAALPRSCVQRQKFGVRVTLSVKAKSPL